MKKLLAAIAAAFVLSACSGSSNPVGPTPEPYGAKFASINQEGGTVVVVLEGMERSDFVLEIWNKYAFGTSRPAGAAPLATFGPFGNGTHRFDISRFQCMDLQADVVSPGGGLLKAKQLNPVPGGTCPTPPPPVRPPDQCTEDCDGDDDDDNPPPPPPTCETDPSLCPPPPPTCETDPNLCPPPPPTCETDPSLCPPPPPVCYQAVYTGAPTFELENSGDATELAWVQSNVSGGPFTGPNKLEPGGLFWTSDGFYPVVLVKAAKTYAVYINVTPGQVLYSLSFNKKGERQEISHVSLFVCVAS